MNKIVKIILISVVVLALAFFGYMTYTKSKSPAATAVGNQNGLSIQVDYCQPYKKGRVAISKREQIWVPVAAAVTRGTVPAFLNATGQITATGAGSSTALTGAIFETDADAGETALVSINLP